MAEALLQQGIAVLEAEIVPEILPVILDPDMASIVRKRAEEHGVEYHLQSTLEAIIGLNGRVSGVRVSGTEHSVDAVIVAVRVSRTPSWLSKPDYSRRVRRNQTDQRMATSASRVYAAGDCIETYDLITRRHVFFQLSTTAVRQAWSLGSMRREVNARYPGRRRDDCQIVCLEIASVRTTTGFRKIGMHPNLSG